MPIDIGCDARGHEKVLGVSDISLNKTVSGWLVRAYLHTEETIPTAPHLFAIITSDDKIGAVVNRVRGFKGESIEMVRAFVGA